MHATLLESIPLTYERLVGPLTLRERDRYCSEAAIMEPLLGMPAGWLPRDSAQLDTYMREMLESGSLVVTDTSRALARALLYPPLWPVAWPVFRAIQLLTIGSLPPSIRRAYGFEWRPRDERAFARWTALLRASLRVLPPMAREWPRARREIRRFENVSKSRARTILALIVGGIGLLMMFIAGLWIHAWATAEILHPDPNRVPSVRHSDPPRDWTGAVERGRQVMRTTLSEQNVPGFSVAVGAGGEIVWAEGFGWSDLENRTPISPDTRFRIGTASKLLTSAAVGLLLEQGRLKLDERSRRTCASSLRSNGP